MGGGVSAERDLNTRPSVRKDKIFVFHAVWARMHLMLQKANSRIRRILTRFVQTLGIYVLVCGFLVQLGRTAWLIRHRTGFLLSACAA